MLLCGDAILPAIHIHWQDMDVERVHGFREALLLLDYSDPSSESLKVLVRALAAHPSHPLVQGILQQCLVHPRFMSNAEVRLSYSML